jgi:hypothetical protein
LCEPAHNSEASRSVLLGILIPSSQRTGSLSVSQKRKTEQLAEGNHGRVLPRAATARRCPTSGLPPPRGHHHRHRLLHRRNPTSSPLEPDLRQVRAGEPSVPSPPMCCPLPPSADHPWSSLRRRASRSVCRPSISFRRARLNLPTSRLQLPPPAAPKPKKKVAPPPRAPSAGRSLSSLRWPRL